MGQLMESRRKQTMDNYEKTVFITPGLFIMAIYKDGNLIRTLGTTVKAELVEMNNVKIEKDGHVEFMELSKDVKWLEDGSYYPS